LPHTHRERAKVKARLARIRGQVDAVGRALDEDRECGEVLQQIAAIRGAVTGLMKEVLEGHVREHLAAEDRTPKERALAADELIDVLRRYLR
jgi:DNA-binding FrmR family transcriptional regulator